MSFPDPTLAPPPAGEPSASTTMTKHELTFHSMTRRSNHAELHDPRSSETIKRRHRNSFGRLERAGPFNPPEDGELEHDLT